MIFRTICVCAGLVACFVDSASAQDKDLSAVLNAPIEIERSRPVSVADLDTRFGKLFVTASINGETREFMFDTGSPTILSREIADQLSLTVIGSNTGVDANGDHVTMEIVRVDTLELGGALFRDVPALIFDFSDLSIGSCVFDGGVLGSEILAGSAWRIDTENQKLSFAASAEEIGEGERVLAAELSDFGYPHAPVISYRVGDVTDQALVDTGNAEFITLYRALTNADSVRDQIVRGSLANGRGSEGESAGGYGEITDLVRFTLEDFQIGGLSLGPVRATTRGVPPTLVGAGVLDAYQVVLDYPGRRFILEAREEPAPSQPEAGYAVSFVEGRATVVQVFDGSAASQAGLRLGDQVISIDGRSLEVTPDNPMCGSALWLLTEFEAADGGVLVVRRGGIDHTLTISPAELGR